MEEEVEEVEGDEEAVTDDGEDEGQEMSTRAEAVPAPAFMRAAARRGLRYIEEGHGGDGLVPATIAAARDMARGVITEPKWRKIGPWIARHMVDLDAPKNRDRNHPEYPGAGLVAHLLWGSGPSKQLAQRAQAYAERVVARLDENRAGPASTPAPKKDQIFGSDKNEPGSAKDKSGDIQLTAAIETSLTNKASEHNKEMDDANKPAWTRVTKGALESVWRRGAGAFSTSHRPGMSRQQWAMGRVNAFLYLARNGRPENPKYVGDNDLLHSDHPRYSKGD